MARIDVRAATPGPSTHTRSKASASECMESAPATIFSPVESAHRRCLILGQPPVRKSESAHAERGKTGARECPADTPPTTADDATSPASLRLAAAGEFVSDRARNSDQNPHWP